MVSRWEREDSRVIGCFSILLQPLLLVGLGIGFGISKCGYNNYKSKDCHSRQAEIVALDPSQSINYVFRDHNGYRVNFTDSVGIVQEITFYEQGESWEGKLPTDISSELAEKFPSLTRFRYSPGVVLIKDLLPGSSPFYQAVWFSNQENQRWGFACNKHKKPHYEIHVPRNTLLCP